MKKTILSLVPGLLLVSTFLFAQEPVDYRLPVAGW
jgi:hypothetical protein